MELELRLDSAIVGQTLGWRELGGAMLPSMPWLGFLLKQNIETKIKIIAFAIIKPQKILEISAYRSCNILECVSCLKNADFAWMNDDFDGFSQ